MRISLVRSIFLIWVIWFAASPFCLSQDSDSLSGSRILDRLSGMGEQVMSHLTFEKGRHSLVVFPVMGYSPVVNLELGVMPVWRIEPANGHVGQFYRPTTITPSIIASVTGMFEVEVSVETFTRHLWVTNLKSQFVYLPDKFYSVGNQLVNVEPVKYKAYRYRLEGNIMKGWGERFFYGVEIDAGYNTHHSREGMMIPADVTGANGGWCNALGPVIAYDTRDNATWPTKGMYLNLSSLFSDPVLGSEYTFQQLTFEGKWFVSPWIEKNVLATQFFAETGSGNIPFYKMPLIGGKYALRGIPHPLKYSDRDAWFLQSEFRRHLWWRFGGVAFGGVGSSFHDFSNAFKAIYGTVGAGLRIQVLPNEKLHLRIDYGLSNGGDHALYLSIREAF